MTEIVSRDRCCGCAACMENCPSSCITMREDAEGFHYPHIEQKDCISCGNCQKICPMRAEDKTTDPICYLAYAQDERLRLESSSGGVFSVLAQFVLDGGGVVFGAMFDQAGELVQRGVEDQGGLAALRGSKYLQSDMRGTYQAIREARDQGKPVLFCGTPCQTAAVERVVGASGLVLVDVVCHGVPSPGVYRKYAAELERAHGAPMTRVNFRDKATGWKRFSMSAEFKNGERYEAPLDKDPYLRLFLSDLDLRPSCHSCGIRGVTSHADLTLGDFWGAGKVFPGMDDDKGLSLVMAHTEQGEALLDKLTLQGQLTRERVTFDAAADYNPCLKRPVAKPASREAFFEQLDVLTCAQLASRVAPKPSMAGRVKGLVKRVLGK